MTPLATATLIIGANIPDIDGIAYLISSDTALGVRRGWTHGVLAMIILPWVVAGTVTLFNYLIQRKRNAEPQLLNLWPVLALAYLAVFSHPFLDWLNTYGIRLLMPFDGRWFYGDAVSIVDPWIWLLAGSSVVLAHTRSLSTIVAWSLLGAFLTVLVSNVTSVPTTAKLVWCIGIGLITGLRAWGGLRHRIATVATLTLSTALMYVVAMAIVTQLTQLYVESWLTTHEIIPQKIMAGPTPANPFRRDIIVIDSRHYHFLQANWFFGDVRIRENGGVISRLDTPGPIVSAALRAPQIQGIQDWMRFPNFQIEKMSNGYRVIVRDVRFARSSMTGIGTAVVELDQDLNIQKVY